MSIVKLAVPGPGFVGKAQQHAGSNWLKNKILPKKIEQVVPKVISTTAYNQQLVKKI